MKSINIQGDNHLNHEKKAVRKSNGEDALFHLQIDETANNNNHPRFLWSDQTKRNSLKQDSRPNPFHFTAPKKKKKDLETKTNPFHFRPPAGDDGVRFSCPSCKDSSVKMVALMKRKDTEKQHYVLLPLAAISDGDADVKRQFLQVSTDFNGESDAKRQQFLLTNFNEEDQIDETY